MQKLRQTACKIYLLLAHFSLQEKKLFPQIGVKRNNYLFEETFRIKNSIRQNINEHALLLQQRILVFFRSSLQYPYVGAPSAYCMGCYRQPQRSCPASYIPNTIQSTKSIKINNLKVAFFSQRIRFPKVADLHFGSLSHASLFQIHNLNNSFFNLKPKHRRNQTTKK